MSSTIQVSCAILALVSAVTTTAAAEPARVRGRMVVLTSPTDQVVGGESLARTIESYLVDLAIVVEVLEHPSPGAPLEDVRQEVVALAREHEADFAVWSRPVGEGELVLYVAHVQGEAALVRRINLEDEPDSTLRRTVATVVRTVVETRLLETLAGAEPVGDSPPAESRRWELGVEAGYGLRWLLAPGPTHQMVTAAVDLGLLDWIGVRLSGRLGLPVSPAAAPEGGESWRAAVVAAAGLDRTVGIVSAGALVGLDLEWVWGQVALEGDRGEATFSRLVPGVSLRGFIRVRLYRGLVITGGLEAVVRPSRRVYMLQGVPVVSSGYLDVAVEVGVGWRFL